MVPFLIVLLALSLVTAWAVCRHRQCERTRSRANLAVKRWVDRLIDGEIKLQSLENQSTLVMGVAEPLDHFRGVSKKAVEELADPIDDLFMCHAAAERLLVEARADLEDIGFLRLDGYQRAISRLEIDEVTVSTDDVTKHRLFRTDRPDIGMQPPELWRLVDQRHAEASAKLDRLKAQVKEAWDGIDRLLSLMAQTEVVEATLHERDLDPEPYANSRFALTDSLNELRERSQFDPLGVAETTAQLDGAVTALRERLERVEQTLGHLEKLPAAIDAAERRLDELRSVDMRLIEPGFEPEVMLDKAEENATSAWEHLRDGGDRRALEHAAEASDLANELSTLIELSVEVRESGESRITEEKDRLKKLRKQLPEHRSTLDNLVKSYATEALEPALTNFERASMALVHAEHCLVDATSAMKGTEQRYLAGNELLSRATAALEAIEDLYHEIDGKAEELDEIREETEETLEELRETLDDLVERLGDDKSFVSSATFQELTSLCEIVEEAESQAKIKRPNWLDLEHRAEFLEPLVMQLAERVTAEEEAHSQFEEQLVQAEKLCDELAALLKGRDKSRPLAERALDASKDELEWIRTRSKEDRPNWVELAADVEVTINHLNDGKSLANADISTAAAVRQAVAAAAVAVRSADRSYGYGCRAGLEMARAELMTARSALKMGDYETGAKHAAESLRRTNESENRALAVIRTKEAQAARRSMIWKSMTPRLGSFRSSKLRGVSRSSFGSSSGRSSFGGSTHRSDRPDPG